jgi:hypothetical protein
VELSLLNLMNAYMPQYLINGAQRCMALGGHLVQAQGQPRILKFRGTVKHNPYREDLQVLHLPYERPEQTTTLLRPLSHLLLVLHRLSLGRRFLLIVSHCQLLPQGSTYFFAYIFATDQRIISIIFRRWCNTVQHENNLCEITFFARLCEDGNWLRTFLNLRSSKTHTTV